MASAPPPVTDLPQVIAQLQQVSQSVQQVQAVLQGNPSQGVISYSMITDHVKDVAPQVVSLSQGLETLRQQVVKVETTLEPVLARADDEIGKLKLQSQNIQEVVTKEIRNLTGSVTQELQAQSTKHDSLIQHAQQKFNDLESSQQTLVDGAKTRFDELEALRTNFELQVAAKVLELDQKMAEVNRVCNQAAMNAATDSTNTRGSDGRTHYFKDISEFKAVQFLEKYSGDTRSGYKNWIRKLKNALDAARGPNYRLALDGIEKHRISADFE